MSKFYEGEKINLNFLYKETKKNFLLIFLIILFYLFINKFHLQNNNLFIKGIMISSIFFTLFIFKLKFDKDEFDSNKFIECVIILGFIMRIGYMLYTPCNIRGHDVGEISENGYGHATYILTIMKKHMLPNNNQIQFYQQPFFYILGSIISKIVNSILHKNDLFSLVDAAKIISCFASCSILLVSKQLFYEIKLNKSAQKIAIIILSFLPNFYLMGGRVNCDALATWFMTLSLLYTIKFYKEQSWNNIIILAFIYGCAMMTKISCGIMAVFTSVVIIKCLYIHFKNRTFKKIFLKLCIFSIISFPLGLWFSIRNYILFNQKFTYVLEQDVNSQLYCGDHSLFSRFCILSLKNIFSSPYANPFGDFNYPAYLIKCMAFGEFNLNKTGIVPIMLLFSILILVFVFIISLFFVCKNYKNSKIIIRAMALIFLFIYLTSIKFNINYPFGCSMDFRYIEITAVIGSIFIGEFYELFKSNEFLKISINLVIGTYSIFSILMYLLI